MSAKVGIENLKAVVDLGLAVVEAGVKISADGKVDAQDLGAVVAVIPAIPPAIAAGGQIPAELSDLDSEEAAELAAHVMAKLAVDDAKARAVIEASLKVAVAVVGLVKAVKA